MADEQQRRRGNAATAESWTRASHVGETRRGRLGLSTGTKRRTSGGCAARTSDGGFIAGERWAFGECGRPARGPAVGGASEPCQTQALCLDFTQTDRCRPFGVHGGESSSPGTGMDATSGAQRARPAMGRSELTPRGPALHFGGARPVSGRGEAGSPPLHRRGHRPRVVWSSDLAARWWTREMSRRAPSERGAWWSHGRLRSDVCETGRWVRRFRNREAQESSGRGRPATGVRRNGRSRGARP